MPANLTAQYRAADAKFRAAKTHDERRLALEEMLSTIPKHKGTEKMQADIKRRLARLKQEAERRTGKRVHTVHVEPEGAAQVLLMGPPNCGKSSLLAAMTRAEPSIADYAFTTTRPQPGMMRYEDVQIQLVDLPPVTADHMDPWMGNVAQGADGALLLADPTTPGVLAGLEEIMERMAAAHVPLVGELPEDSDPRDLPLPTLMVITKADQASEDDMEVLAELYGELFPIVRFSATKGVGGQALRTGVWRMLRLVRVYTKPPGKKAERTEPFVLPLGSTVLEVAARIHRDLPDKLAYARLWGGQVDGQRVGRDFELRDRDLLELSS